MSQFHPKIVKKRTKELEQRERDPKHAGYILELEKHKIKAAQEYYEAAGPLFAELSASGYEVRSLDIFTKSDAYKDAIPILLKWLPKIANRRVKESIVRALSVPWAKGLAEAALLAKFRSASESDNLGLKWAISNALEVLATDKIFDAIVELARDRRHGAARQMLAMALGKMKNPKAVDVLIGLIEDDDVAGHSIIALKKLNATEARLYILPFLKHPKTWIRREAKKALNKLDDLV